MLPERRDTLLLRETHHRCTNDLQLVVSLLGLQAQQAESIEVRQALTDASERVAILARARNDLYRERSPDLAITLRQVCEALSAQAEPRAIMISLHVEPDLPALPGERIMTLALVVNELMTNAIKHAFAGMAGRIQATVSPQARGGIAILIDDDGLPFHEGADSGKGLGIGLVKRLMASIGGLFIPLPPGSKRFELRLPV